MFKVVQKKISEDRILLENRLQELSKLLEEKEEIHVKKVKNIMISNESKIQNLEKFIQGLKKLLNEKVLVFTNKIRVLQENLVTEMTEKANIQAENIKYKKMIEKYAQKEKLHQEILGNLQNEKTKLETLHSTAKHLIEIRIGYLEKELAFRDEENNELNERLKFLNGELKAKQENFKNHENEALRRFQQQYEHLKLEFEKLQFGKAEEIFELKRQNEEINKNLEILKNCQNCYSLKENMENLTAKKEKIEANRLEIVAENESLKRTAIYVAIENVFEKAKRQKLSENQALENTIKAMTSHMSTANKPTK
uniref:Uncharacterized protein n=1 Tax=Acrobeloides nanus TaxID=290746 RepID=A0A914EDX1_9BILA